MTSVIRTHKTSEMRLPVSGFWQNYLIVNLNASGKTKISNAFKTTSESSWGIKRLNKSNSVLIMKKDLL